MNISERDALLRYLLEHCSSDRGYVHDPQKVLESYPSKSAFDTRGAIASLHADKLIAVQWASGQICALHICPIAQTYIDTKVVEEQQLATEKIENRKAIRREWVRWGVTTLLASIGVVGTVKAFWPEIQEAIQWIRSLWGG